MTIANILKAEPLSGTVFKKYGLEYSNCLDLDLEEACQRYSINSQQVKLELANLRRFSKQLPEAFDRLLDSILYQHQLIKIKIPLIREALLIAIEHETSYQYELLTTKLKFELLNENLEIHLYKEEMILFPVFINLWARQLRPSDDLLPFWLKYPIESLESEHVSAKAILSEIKELSQYYKIPTNTSKQYKEACLKLDDFERSMVNIINLEDEALFPEALVLEKIFAAD
ncbi:MAG: hemerythrin domain-containing protein [Bacteroidota bacterium]